MNTNTIISKILKRIISATHVYIYIYIFKLVCVWFSFDRIDSDRIDSDRIDSDIIDSERIDLCLDTIM
jgi:hypothetical protein